MLTCWNSFVATDADPCIYILCKSQQVSIYSTLWSGQSDRQNHHSHTHYYYYFTHLSWQDEKHKKEWSGGGCAACFFLLSMSGECLVSRLWGVGIILLGKRSNCHCVCVGSSLYSWVDEVLLREIAVPPQGQCGPCGRKQKFEATLRFLWFYLQVSCQMIDDRFEVHTPWLILKKDPIAGLGVCWSTTRHGPSHWAPPWTIPGPFLVTTLYSGETGSRHRNLWDCACSVWCFVLCSAELYIRTSQWFSLILFELFLHFLFIYILKFNVS